jgi:hypothetical protein
MAAAIYVDKNGDSHIIDDPGAANPGVPPEALEAIKKYKLCVINYGDKALTNDKLQEAINKAIKDADAARQARKPGEAAREKIKNDAKTALAATDKKIDEDCKKEVAAADAEMNAIVSAINAGNPPPGYANMPKGQAATKAHDERDKKVNGKDGIEERCKKKKRDARSDSQTKTTAEINKLPPLPTLPAAPPLTCVANAECKDCEKAYISPNPAYVQPAKKDDPPPTEPIYKGHTGSTTSLDNDRMYFCTCGLKP